MREYLNTLITVVIVSQLAVQFAPCKDDAKKYIRLICGIVVMMCLMRPISAIIKNGGEFFNEVRELFTYKADLTASTDKYSVEAATVITYISDKFKIPEEDIKITFITDEADLDLIELHIYIHDIDSSIQKSIENELNRELSVPVYVFTE